MSTYRRFFTVQKVRSSEAITFYFWGLGSILSVKPDLSVVLISFVIIIRRWDNGQGVFVWFGANNLERWRPG